MKLLLALFCKDRKKYALNLINSLKLLDIDKSNLLLTIYDSSIDQDEIIRNSDIDINFEFKIIFTPNNQEGELGNLNQNMQSAFTYAIFNRFDYIFFLQDDTQIVREVNFNELSNLFKLLDKDNVIHLNLSFHRGNEHDFNEKVALSSERSYYIDRKSSCHDVGIYKVTKIQSLNFNFLKDEDFRDKKYYLLGYHSAKVLNPFMHYLPWPISSRAYNKKKRSFFIYLLRSILIFLNSIGVKAGLNKFKVMTKEDTKKLFSRDLNFLPTAEEYLTTHNILKKPWSYDMFYDPYKFRDIKKIMRLDFIFNGSTEYINSLKILKKKCLHKKFVRKINS